MPRTKPEDPPIEKALVASWCSGRRVKDSDRIWRGLFLDIGLDEDLDRAAAAAEWPRAWISHLDSYREHWCCPSPTNVFVMITGIPFKPMMMQMIARRPKKAAECCMGVRWPYGETSKLWLPVLFDDLVQQGYLKPIPIVVSSTSTDDLLAALVLHNDVIERSEVAIDQPMDFCDLALPIMPGQEVNRSNGDVGTPMSPITCGHPEKLTRAYVTALLAPPNVTQTWEYSWRDLQVRAGDFSQSVDQKENEDATASRSGTDQHGGNQPAKAAASTTNGRTSAPAANPAAPESERVRVGRAIHPAKRIS